MSDHFASPQPVFIGLGSNLGDRLQHLRDAIGFLGQTPGMRLLKTSSIYETAPVGPVEQGPFLNAVAWLETALPPLALLDRLKGYEQAAGRVLGLRWGPRTIDLDILIYGALCLQHEWLNIPHRELTRRAFVLVPLAELAADLRVPGMGEKTVQDWLNRQSDRGDVHWYAGAL